MSEQEVIRGRTKQYGNTPIILLVVGVIALLYDIIQAVHNSRDGSFSFWAYLTDSGYKILLLCSIFVILIALYMLFQSRCEIVVTTRKVYGKAVFGKQVDLPIDSITAVGTSAFNGIAVASSSGRILFWGITNRDEVRSAISNLLMERQEKKSSAETTIKQEVPQSDADELAKYKKLLDDGVITQAEFDAKKKQILGL